MELEGSLPCSQESATGPYLQPNKEKTSNHNISNLNNIAPSTPRSSKWYLPFMLPARQEHKQTFLQCCAHLILLHFIILVIPCKKCELQDSLLWVFSNLPLLLPGPNILLCTVFWNTLNLCSPTVEHQLSYPCKITREINIKFLSISVVFSEGRRENNIFWTERHTILPEIKLLIISSWDKFCFVAVISKYLSLSHFHMIY
jgi:hypothetical protein